MTDDVIQTIERIEQDFADRNEPFDDIEFPEERLLDKLCDEHTLVEYKARFLMMFSTFDYNRNANQLVDNIIELEEMHPELFDPRYVHLHENELSSLFSEIRFRYPNRDSDGWDENCQILNESYHGQVTELILSTGCDAPTFVEQLNDDGFLYLKGDKIAPMFTRFIDQYIAPMDGMWELDIPTDTHIIRLTEELCNAQMDADDVRAWWQVIGQQADIDRHVVDGAMWQVGNNWDQWGEDYWEDVTDL